MPKFRGNRLLKLADELERDAKRRGGIKFDMGTWGEGEQIEMSCKTKACALGLAAISGIFASDGLKWKPESSSDDSYIHIEVMYKGQTDISAASGLFGISEEEAVYLFCGDEGERGSSGERKVAKKIREFVAAKEWATEKGAERHRSILEQCGSL